MDYLPIFVDLKGRRCLVVGAGEVAARKASMLLSAGATVRVVAPRLSPGMEELCGHADVACERRRFEPGDLEACALVIAATDDAGVNRAVSEGARERGLPVNVVDQPALSTFIMPSVVDRSPVLIAVSTGGASPVLARLIRGRLEVSIPAAYGRLATFARELRARVKERFRDVAARRAFWEEVLEGPVAELVLAGREGEARRVLESTLEGASRLPTGEVYLVGAGPGDPDLLTARALRLMQKADVVVYDRLVTEAVLALTRRDAERIYAGKRRSRHVLPQESINELLIRLAREGKRVLRLKGGDPFIFGRGGEEIETLADNGIPFQVVPGITAASGCAAYAGIPLTHRDYAQSCVFVTGHLGDDRPNLDFGALVRPQQTIVVYMGLIGLPVICESLIAHGMDPAMPAAIVEHGTTPTQRVLTGTLSSIPGLVAQARLRAPTLTIIGEVVRLHGKLRWFETRSESEPGPRW